VYSYIISYILPWDGHDYPVSVGNLALTAAKL